MMKNMEMVMFHGLILNVGLMVVIIMCNSSCIVALSSTSPLDDGSMVNTNTNFRTPSGGRRPSATFIFGDSLVDVGMNNHLPASIAKANFLPNGIDFPGRTATGRFCNGRLISDFLGEHWGMESPLAYTDPANTGEKLLRGANFASAGAGILNDTGFIFIQRFPMSKQVEFMGEYVRRLQTMVGETQASNIVSNGFFSITIGANDFLSNYFVPPTSPRKLEFTLPEFHDFLITKLRHQITEIYGYGARNIIVVGLGPIGCMPVIIGQRFLVDPNGQCIDNFQQVAITFNQKLISMSNELQQELPGSFFLYSNAFDIAMDMIQNASSFGFQNVNTACCGRGTQYRSLVPCRPQMKICEDRDSYIFWDPFHPTERVNKIIAQRALFGPPSDISPINLSQLYS